ncbi:transposase [Elysia marginata]|uniref:Transposase n=1 Tax=Elysia marginata TaxID=1093978 RepID=A0AAV4ICQ0_9GAST|nr:transposase [Elysia marginata]
MEAVEYRSVIKFLYLKGQNSTEIHQEMVQVYAEKCPHYSTVTHWVRKFKSGFLSVIDEHREGRPPSVVTEKNVSTVEKLIMQDRRITVKQLAFETKISIGSVETILHDHLNLNKVSARWVPRLLTTDQKQERVNCCKHLLRQEANDAFFFRRIVTMDETWIYQLDPELKSASMQWRRPSSSPPKKAKVTQSSGKVMLSCFWDCDGTIMTDYMEKGKTVTRIYYSGLLKRLRSELARRRRGKLRSGVLLLAFCMILLLLIKHEKQLRQLNGAASEIFHILYTRRI